MNFFFADSLRLKFLSYLPVKNLPGNPCYVSLDVDECDSGVSQCHSHASCKNTAPGYCCDCNEGYYGNGVVCEREG